MYPQVFGKYVLERELARGGMARVLLATLRGAGGFEKKLVVKQIRDELAFDDEFVRRFVEEAKTTVALSHPNIVPVYELGVELGTYFLTMEFVEGVSLAELLRTATQEKQPLTPEEGAYVGVEVCRALDYAHRRMKVVHRDVTPRNVMVDEEGQVKVIDFGIAARASVEGHEVFGSPGHMPPEQAAGKEVTPATDIFAVAVLLMELWSGKPPFRRKDAKASEEAMRGPHPKPSAIDPRLLPLDDAILSAMSLDPASRPQQADDLARTLRKFLAEVDLGDVERQLGERVRASRARPAAAPRSERSGGLDRPPSRPAATEMGTKTFAARSEVLVAAASQPPPVEGGDAHVGTRRLPASTPPPSPSKPEPEFIETIATRPIETDGHAATPARARRGWAMAALGATAVLGAFFAVRSGLLKTEATEVPTTTAETSASPSPSPSTPTSASASASTTTSAVVSTTSGPAPSPVPSMGAITTGSTTANDKARVALYGDPGTVVTVDGAGHGGCPKSVALDPGDHSFAFAFSPTGETKGISLKLRAGERVTLRADFTSATPTIRVVR